MQTRARAVRGRAAPAHVSKAGRLVFSTPKLMAPDGLGVSVDAWMLLLNEKGPAGFGSSFRIRTLPTFDGSRDTSAVAQVVKVGQLRQSLVRIL